MMTPHSGHRPKCPCRISVSFAPPVVTSVASYSIQAWSRAPTSALLRWHARHREHAGANYYDVRRRARRWQSQASVLAWNSRDHRTHALVALLAPRRGRRPPSGQSWPYRRDHLNFDDEPIGFGTATANWGTDDGGNDESIKGRTIRLLEPACGSITRPGHGGFRFRRALDVCSRAAASTAARPRRPVWRTRTWCGDLRRVGASTNPATARTSRQGARHNWNRPRRTAVGHTFLILASSRARVHHRWPTSAGARGYSLAVVAKGCLIWPLACLALLTSDMAYPTATPCAPLLRESVSCPDWMPDLSVRSHAGRGNRAYPPHHERHVRSRICAPCLHDRKRKHRLEKQYNSPLLLTWGAARSSGFLTPHAAEWHVGLGQDRRHFACTPT